MVMSFFAVAFVYAHAQSKGALPIPGVGGKASPISGDIPFGGKVISPPVPCMYNGVFSSFVYVSSARFFDNRIPLAYIWSLPPLTKTLLFGPPTHPGQLVLGLSSRIPSVCYTTTVPPVPLPPAFHIDLIGTSLVTGNTKETTVPGTAGKAN